MRFEFHPAKSHKNKIDPSRGFGLERAESLDWASAVTIADERKDYGEPRYITFGLLAARLYVLVWTPRGADVYRVISLRKANARERNYYEKNRHD